MAASGRGPPRGPAKEARGRIPAAADLATQPGILEPAPTPRAVFDEQEKLTSIGAYTVVGVLGRGGMGIVYEVERAGTRRALKTIEARFLDLADGQAGQRFTQEIRVLERLDHPGIVRLFDYGLARHPMGYELAYFVMEKLEGETLDKRMAKGALPPAEALHVTGEITRALTYLQDNGVLHRDIKPANVLIEPTGRVVLMDFGLARSEEFTRLTQMGHVIGTLPYMSPEALRGRPVDSTSDVYAVGVLLYEMLLLAQPFKDRDPSRLVIEIRDGVRWPEGADFGPQTAAIKALVGRLLAYDPALRPRPPEVGPEVAFLLAPPRRLEPTASVLAPVASEDTPRAETAPRPSAPTESRVVKSLVREGGPTWLAAVILAAAVGTAAFMFGTRRPEAPLPIPVPVAPPPPRPVVVAPEPPEPVPEFTDADEAFAYGDRALRDGRHRDAITAFLAARRLNPALAQIYRRLGDAHLSVGEVEPALASYRTYLALKPKAPDAEQLKKLLEGM